MADRPEMFGPTRGFSGMADSMEPCKMLLGPTLVAMATKFGLGAEIQSPTCRDVSQHDNSRAVKRYHREIFRALS